MMDIIEASIFTDMIQEVESEKPIFTFEFIQLYNAVRKFRDYFTANQVVFNIPASLTTELNEYVTLLEDRKFGDVVLSKDQRNLVEALRVLGDLSQYHGAGDVELLYKSGNFISPKLSKYYTSYYAGHQDGIWLISISFETLWYHFKSLSMAGHSMGASEHWFYMNQPYGTVETYFRGYLAHGVVGQPFFKLHFLTSGSPKSLIPPSGRLCIEDRGDVSIKATLNVVSTGSGINYEQTEDVAVNGDINYIVAECMDADLGSTLWAKIYEISVVNN